MDGCAGHQGRYGSQSGQVRGYEGTDGGRCHRYLQEELALLVPHNYAPDVALGYELPDSAY